MSVKPRCSGSQIIWFSVWQSVTILWVFWVCRKLELYVCGGLTCWKHIGVLSECSPLACSFVGLHQYRVVANLKFCTFCFSSLFVPTSDYAHNQWVNSSRFMSHYSTWSARTDPTEQGPKKHILGWKKANGNARKAYWADWSWVH